MFAAKNMTKLIMLFYCLAYADGAYAAGLKYVETANGKKSSYTREFVQWTHSRLVFEKDLKRVAVGQNKTMEVEVLGGKEALVLAKNVGRTSLIVWYADETTETFLFSVIEDLSVLRGVLRDIHKNIYIELAPDRAALVLRGKVPTIEFRVAAEAAAKNYLNAGKRQTDSANVVLQAGKGAAVSSDKFSISGSGASAVVKGGAAIINLVQVEELPMSMTDKILDSIREVGGVDVVVERIMHGQVENDAVDTLLLKGKVENQVSLIRILNIASSLYTGSAAGRDGNNGIIAIADESGALLKKRNTGANTNSSSDLGGVSKGSGRNNISANIARAKMLSVAGGRILSMIEVKDIPQVRISVQLHEVNRKRMRSWQPNLTAVTEGYNNTGAYAGGLATGAGGVNMPFSNQGTMIENSLQILGGAASNNLTIGGSAMAFDLLFSLLENEGISRTLSRPTLTVLAGEDAVFQVGGEVPIPKAFAPSGVVSGDQVGTNTAGVFSGTEFKAFGVQLKVRAMVGEDDRITLDVNPTVSVPDSLLTQNIAGSTGTALNSTAFNVRSIDTSARLRDGQPLIIGGLVSRDMSDDQSYTPGMKDVPLLGNFAQAYNKADNDRELIIIVTPTIIREAVNTTALWQFNEINDYLEKVVAD